MALQSLGPAVQALAASGFVVDCTVEGLMHAPEIGTVQRGGARVLTIPDEHPEALERLVPDPSLEAPVRAGMRMLKRARRMQVTSDAGTQLVVSLAGAVVAGGWGFADRPGTLAQWPGGLCMCHPASGCVNGVLVLAPGDVNLTFKRYLESRVTLLVQNDYVVDIKGSGMDANLIRSYFSAWGDRDAYAVSHVGWGMNPAARWDSMAMYDKRDFNGTELRTCAGSFLYSTGANEVAGRRTAGHFDLPLCDCTVALDDHVVVEEGVLNMAAFAD
jgi:2,5-dihydroxypyridine 5,6-dioxygenase